MITVLAEKPSQARIFARVLGAVEDKKQWFEGNGYYVTWCLGHLVGISTPLSLGEWRADSLPLIPDRFVLAPVPEDGINGEPSRETLERLDVIRRLFSLSESIIEATDAGREGEGIFRNVYEYLECDKPFSRLWTDSLADAALKRAFADLRPSWEYDALAHAAREREEEDWLIGINATRAITLTAEADSVITAGRVQTAALKMVCDRYEEASTFEPQPFWFIRGEFVKDDVKVRWRSKDKFLVKETAEAVMRALRDDWRLAVQEVGVERNSASPPLPHNLGSLQKEANSKFGYSAAETEESVQILYERQLVSYPRTESRYMTEEDFAGMSDVVKLFENNPQYGLVARALAKRGLSMRCVDNKKAVEHSPLVVTGKTPGHLSDRESRIYDLILSRFMEAFCPESVSDVTSVTLIGAGREYTARSNKEVALGWKCVGKGHGDDDDAQDDVDDTEYQTLLPNLKKGDIVQILKAEIVEDRTKPRPLLTDATLLSLMENAGGLKGDGAGVPGMSGCGIGTAATRGREIDILVQRGYVVRDRDSRKLTPTQLGLDLYRAVRNMDICRIELTAGMETSLKSIGEGVCPPALHAAKVRGFVRNLTAEILVGRDFDNLRAKVKKTYRCPGCGAEVRITAGGVTCGCGFRLKPKVAGKTLSRKMMEDLVVKGRTGKLKGFMRQDGGEFEAALAMDSSGSVSFISSGEGRAEKGAAVPCPKCGGELKDSPKARSCETCGLTFWKEAYGARLTDKEMDALLGNGSVSPKAPFIKKDSGRNYHATLVLTEEYRYRLAFGNDDGELPKDIVICSRCGHVMTWTQKALLCDCGRKLWRTMFGRPMGVAELRDLAEKGRTGVLDGFISRKKNTAYSAALALDGDDNVKLVFD